MFGLRYHVASLAAVFVALAVGILLGVAVSGRVTDASEGLEEENLRNDNQRLQQDLEAARAAEDAANQRGEGSEELLARAYPALMSGRLEGENVAMIFLGPSDGSARAEVERTLADADGGSPARVVALNVPVDGADLDATLESDELLASYAGDDGDFSELGAELGRELAESGETPLWDALSTHLVEEQEGPEAPAVDSAVVVLTWLPPDDATGDGDAAAEAEATSSLMEGLVRGLDDAGIPIVGVSATEDDPAKIDFYRDQGISSVDDVDEPAGRLALALLLGGADPGHYGLDEEADGIVPPFDPVSDEGE
ncbi:MAG TPA: copper transporter [Gaiellaceae bacterium]|jgi:copper transport outer membrane protein MctB|nr:copper transporter [Gaiellaceae bacterium]